MFITILLLYKKQIAQCLIWTETEKVTKLKIKNKQINNYFRENKYA